MHFLRWIGVETRSQPDVTGVAVGVAIGGGDVFVAEAFDALELGRFMKSWEFDGNMTWAFKEDWV